MKISKKAFISIAAVGVLGLTALSYIGVLPGSKLLSSVLSESEPICYWQYEIEGMTKDKMNLQEEYSQASATVESTKNDIAKNDQLLAAASAALIALPPKIQSDTVMAAEKAKVDVIFRQLLSKKDIESMSLYIQTAKSSADAAKKESDRLKNVADTLNVKLAPLKKAADVFTAWQAEYKSMSEIYNQMLSSQRTLDNANLTIANAKANYDVAKKASDDLKVQLTSRTTLDTQIVQIPELKVNSDTLAQQVIDKKPLEAANTLLQDAKAAMDRAKADVDFAKKTANDLALQIPARKSLDTQAAQLPSLRVISDKLATQVRDKNNLNAANTALTNAKAAMERAKAAYKTKNHSTVVTYNDSVTAYNLANKKYTDLLAAYNKYNDTSTLAEITARSSIASSTYNSLNTSYYTALSAYNTQFASSTKTAPVLQTIYDTTINAQIPAAIKVYDNAVAAYDASNTKYLNLLTPYNRKYGSDTSTLAQVTAKSATALAAYNTMNNAYNTGVLAYYTKYAKSMKSAQELQALYDREMGTVNASNDQTQRATAEIKKTTPQHTALNAQYNSVLAAYNAKYAKGAPSDAALRTYTTAFDTYTSADNDYKKALVETQRLATEYEAAQTNVANATAAYKAKYTDNSIALEDLQTSYDKANSIYKKIVSDNDTAKIQLKYAKQDVVKYEAEKVTLAKKAEVASKNQQIAQNNIMENRRTLAAAEKNICPTKEMICNDGLDNDRDDRTDSKDTDCGGIVENIAALTTTDQTVDIVSTEDGTGGTTGGDTGGTTGETGLDNGVNNLVVTINGVSLKECYPEDEFEDVKKHLTDAKAEYEGLVSGNEQAINKKKEEFKDPKNDKLILDGLKKELGKDYEKIFKSVGKEKMIEGVRKEIFKQAEDTLRDQKILLQKIKEALGNLKICKDSESGSNDRQSCNAQERIKIMDELLLLIGEFNDLVDKETPLIEKHDALVDEYDKEKNSGKTSKMELNKIKDQVNTLGKEVGEIREKQMEIKKKKQEYDAKLKKINCEDEAAYKTAEEQEKQNSSDAIMEKINNLRNQIDTDMKNLGGAEEEGSSGDENLV